MVSRKRGTPQSPDEPAVVAPLLTANYIMLGPGSPTYAVRQLAESLAASAFALPVYEI
jgi:hypothetical protein